MQAIASHQTRLAAALATPPTAVKPLPRYTTIKQAAEDEPELFTEAAYRDLKFKANDRKNSRGEIIKGNGTGPAGVWVQIGAKVLIDREARNRWIESHKIGGE